MWRHLPTPLLALLLSVAPLRPCAAQPEQRTSTMLIKGAAVLAQEEGMAHMAEGRFADAIKPLERAAHAPPLTSAGERLNAATVHNALGGAYKNMARLDEAVASFERALSALSPLTIGAAQADADDARAARLEAAAVTNNLGSVHAEAKRDAEAAAMYDAALEAFDAEAARDEQPDPRNADALNNLADLRHSQGDLEEAERLYADALARREAALGAEHPETAASVNNLAVLLLELRRHGEALPLLRRAANIARATAGAAHPHYATALGNLASGLQLLGKAAEARTRFARALKINAAALGDDHPSTTSAREALEALARS